MKSVIITSSSKPVSYTIAEHSTNKRLTCMTSNLVSSK